MAKLTKFQIDALAYDKHISLTANAGSGKTTVLAKRFVEILVNEKIPISNIVAITFTEKAASELYSKIANELDQRITDPNTQNIFQIEAIRRNLVSAKISTIHSFCIDVLKDYAPEAGIDANFSPIDARTAEELLDQSIDEIIISSLSEGSDSIKKLIRIFSSRSQLVKKIKHLFQKRKTSQFLIDKFYTKTVSEISEYFNNEFDQKLDDYFKEDIEKLVDKIKIINDVAKEYKVSQKQIDINYYLQTILTNNITRDKLKTLLEIKPIILTQKGTVIKKGYLSNNLYEENNSIIDEIAKLFLNINDLSIDDNYINLHNTLASFGKTIAQFYNQINEKYISKKQAKSYLDFEDLLLLTQSLLEKDEVKYLLSEKYKYIMIDEYQDTNETQYNIFMPILNNLATGNLFVVGDEKQSIYMFREAEVELFHQLQEKVQSYDNVGSLLELPHSFRLTPNIAMFTNILFRKLFMDPDRNFNEVQYNELICAYQGEEKGEVEFLIADEEEISESELLAKRIKQLVQTDDAVYDYRDISVLCSKRKNFLELEKVFSEYAIPFSIVGGKGYFQQQLILDVYNYLSFLINPKNDLALATILRSPFYGLSDVELMRIALKEGNDLFSKIKNESKYNDQIELIEEHIQSSIILRPNELIRRIINDTGYWAYVSSKTDSAQEIANLKKLIQKSINLHDQGFSSLYDFTLYLEDAIANEEDEGQAELSTNENSVSVMTIHQAKGLEFKVVALYKMNQKNIDESLKTKDIIIDKNYGILSKLPENDNYFEQYQKAPIIGIYDYVQKRKAAAELKRLLYVAVTRAEHHLILSSTINKGKVLQDSFAGMIFNALSIDTEKDSMQLKDRIEFMKYKENEYIYTEEDNNCNVSFIKNIELKNEKSFEENKIINNNYEIRRDQIVSYEKNEIISASKISLFINCPKKYQLTYEYGYGEVVKLFMNESDLEFNTREDEGALSSNIVGSIIHAILEKDSSTQKLDEVIVSQIRKNNSSIFLSKIEKERIITEIKNIVTNYYLSKSYNELTLLSNHQNEIEFYLRENDYYLYGIIDKLITTEDKIIIVDYKSDKVNDTNFDEKKNTYLNQLYFYAYIIRKEYPHINNYELKIIFVRDDKYSISENISTKELLEFGRVIKESVSKIRTKQFDDYSEGCKNMKYYLL